MREYPDDKACLEALWRMRYSADGVHAHCPKCDDEREFARYETSQQRQSWTCKGCGQHVHPTAGTIYHKSSTSLHLWFYALYLMTSTRCGISSVQLARELGCNYKTALRMATIIREQVMDDDGEPLDGEVEMDESYYGGKRRGKLSGRPKRGRPGPGSHKVTVFGAVERGGRVKVATVPNVRKVTLMPHIERYVLPSATVFTDELKSYNGLEARGYRHQRVNHSAGVYVSGSAHVNSMEGFWALTKNGIRGVFHSVSAKHLQGYLNEYAWRYNHRHDERAMFESLLLRTARTL
jgi:transposase-like protein